MMNIGANGMACANLDDKHSSDLRMAILLFYRLRCFTDLGNRRWLSFTLSSNGHTIP